MKKLILLNIIFLSSAFAKAPVDEMGFVKPHDIAYFKELDVKKPVEDRVRIKELPHIDSIEFQASLNHVVDTTNFESIVRNQDLNNLLLQKLEDAKYPLEDQRIFEEQLNEALAQATLEQGVALGLILLDSETPREDLHKYLNSLSQARSSLSREEAFEYALEAIESRE